MGTFLLLLNENKADLNQIEHGIKVLDKQYIECKQQLIEYFDSLQSKLRTQSIKTMQDLEQIKNKKQAFLKCKQQKLEKHILTQTKLEMIAIQNIKNHKLQN